jgi:hypothetical protein
VGAPACEPDHGMASTLWLKYSGRIVVLLSRSLEV